METTQRSVLMRKILAYFSAAIVGLSSLSMTIAQEEVPHFRLGIGSAVQIGAPGDEEPVLDLQPATLPTAIVGTPWDYDFDDVLLREGDPGVISWTLDGSGDGHSLPIDIDDLSSIGVLSGDPLQAGTHTFVVGVSGSLGGADAQAYTLVVENGIGDIDFAMVDVEDAVPGSEVTSTTVTPVNIQSPVSITATNGAGVSVAGGPFVGSATIDDGQSFVVRMDASGSYETTVASTVTIDDVSRVWSVTTALEPLGFSIADLVDVMPSTVVTSATVDPAGVREPTPISATNGAEISIAGGAFAPSGTIDEGQTFVVRTTSSPDPLGVVSSTITLGSVSDTWSVSTIDELVVTLNNHQVNVVLSGLFGSDWTSARAKRVIVPSGYIIGQNTLGIAAMRTGTGLVGSLTIENRGTIRGRGGLGGQTTVGQNGGDALNLQVPNVTLINTGYIQGGGGSGGRGGKGADGSYYSEINRDPVSGGYFQAGAYRWAVDTNTNYANITWNTSTVLGGISPTATMYYSGGFYYYRGDYVGQAGSYQEYEVYRFARQNNTITGGQGGAGGGGAGYSAGTGYQAPTPGNPGTAGGENTTTNPGATGYGGTGGQGGFIGMPGETGFTGEPGQNSTGGTTFGVVGFAGGRAGYAIVGTPGPGSTIGNTVGHTP